jgi:hypothetical protein
MKLKERGRRKGGNIMPSIKPCLKKEIQRKIEWKGRDRGCNLWQTLITRVEKGRKGKRKKI